MSLESALDEERRAVMDILEGKKNRPQSIARTVRAGSPGPAQSPVRSMLDIGPADVASARAAKHASIAAPGAAGAAGITTMRNESSSRSPTVRSSMLDPLAPPPPPQVRSPGLRPKISPPPASRPVPSGLSSPPLGRLEQSHQYEMLPTIERHSMPKRVSMGGKKMNRKSQSEAHDLQPRGGGALAGALGRSRHGSTGSMLSAKPMSPSRLRSQSPGGRTGSKPSTASLMPDPKRYMLDSGKMVDISSAYRRLSDAALVRSGGSLAGLGKRKESDASRGGEQGSPRLAKDYIDEEALESSDEESEDDSSEDDGWGESSSQKKTRRGRGLDRENKDKDALDDDDGKAARRRAPKSLLAAAEEERKSISGNYQVRSLLEPSVTITGPDGEKPLKKGYGVHPNTSFDTGNGSEVSTPVDSDAEDEIDDIKRAQRLAMSISHIQTSPEASRCLRLIVRGEYSTLQREAEAGLRRQRVYLVATDLSEESAYALEWTIGTVLRDGDTMLAVYAVDDEAGTGASTANAASVVAADPTTGAPIATLAATESTTAPIAAKHSTGGLEIGQGAMEAESLARSLSNQNDGLLPPPKLSALSNLGSSATGSRSDSPAAGGVAENGAATPSKPVDVSSMTKAEKESYMATMEVSDRCVKLLRKTKLQVRVVVEVFRSKSPRHTLTEVIDYLNPTLVILGSRGRSALKGVLLGSFSNYLVTKSSVPVMVARKKLRKASKYKRANRRLSNVLSNPTSKLVNAKID